MNITILANGSRGDTQPYVALGIALKKAGQNVRIAAFENYRDFIESHGLEYFPVRGDVSKIIASGDGKVAINADNPFKLFLSFNKMKNYVYDIQEDFFNACKDSEAVVYHPGAAIGYFTAQYLKIPSILATPFPMSITSEYPSLMFYDWARLGKTYNRITHMIFEKIMWMASSNAIKQFWKSKFGALPESFGCPFSRQNSLQSPTIISCSNNVFPRPNDWPTGIHNTGYWFLEKDTSWQPPKDLQNFLSTGKPPIYVGFGSVGDPKSSHQTTSIVIEGLRRTGQRGILATGWGSMSKPEIVYDDMFFVENIPHDWLFPKMSMVIHHGGAGTTAACLKAGVPSIIIPYGNDQFAWGRKIFELGISSKPIPRKTLTAKKLSEAIQFAMNEEILTKAQKFGKLISSEKGTETAAKIIIETIKK
jgi:sterol 3beta-glucosyltransferase